MSQPATAVKVDPPKPAETKAEKKVAPELPKSAWGWPVASVRMAAPVPLRPGSGAPVSYIVIEPRTETLSTNEWLVQGIETHPAGVIVTPEKGERVLVPWHLCGPATLA